MKLRKTVPTGWWSVFCLLSLELTLAVCAHAQTGRKTPAFEHERDVESTPYWQEPPRWSGQRLIGRLNNRSRGPIIYTIDREGVRDEMLFTLDDAAEITINDVAVSRSDEIAVVGGAYTTDGRAATFLVRISADRKSRVVTRLWPYVPAVVTFTPDGTVCTVGDLKDDNNTTVVASSLLRRFDASGKMISTTSIAKHGDMPQRTSYFFSSRDRLGWLTREGEFIEFSLDGSQIARYEGPAPGDFYYVHGIAMSDDNAVVAGVGRGGKHSLLVLDRQNRGWVPAAVAAQPVPKWLEVLGFDGNTLVTAAGNGRLRRYRLQLATQ